MSAESLQNYLMVFPVLLFCLCVHEWAHAWVAHLLGDETPKWLGRLSLSPLAHADPMGTFIFPSVVMLLNIPFFIGWAKPVPVNGKNFKNMRRDMAFVAAAGPLSNIILAVLFAAAYGLFKAWASKAYVMTGEYNGYVTTFITMLGQGIGINLFLALFNLIPLGPLDGAKVVPLFLPAAAAHKFEQMQVHGGNILLGLILLSFVGINVFKILSIPVSWATHTLIQVFTL